MWPIGPHNIDNESEVIACDYAGAWLVKGELGSAEGLVDMSFVGHFPAKG